MSCTARSSGALTPVQRLSVGRNPNWVEIVDLPGIYDIHGFSDDERIVRQLLETAP